jgi:hypothetical protein
MSAVPAEWFLKSRGSRNPPKVVFDEYIRCYTKKTIIGSCRDYRAGARIDFEMDTADKDRQIECRSHSVGHARAAADTGVSDRVAQVCEEPRRCAAAADRPLSAGGGTGSVDYFVKFFVT